MARYAKSGRHFRSQHGEPVSRTFVNGSFKNVVDVYRTPSRTIGALFTSSDYEFLGSPKQLRIYVLKFYPPTVSVDDVFSEYDSILSVP